jgi:hypothetical protein
MHLCTLVTGGAIRDLAVLFETLRIFQKDLPTIYIMTDEATRDAILKLKYPAEKLHISVALERYKGLGRKEMEAMPGTTFPTLWCDFMAEKCALLEFAAGPVHVSDPIHATPPNFGIPNHSRGLVPNSGW